MKPLKTYRVRWTETFEVEVEATSEEKAIDLAYCEDPEVSRVNATLNGIECLGGYCEEHAYAFEDESCPVCTEEDFRTDMARESA